MKRRGEGLKKMNKKRRGTQPSHQKNLTEINGEGDSLIRIIRTGNLAVFWND